jgi:hypothetical protein
MADYGLLTNEQINGRIAGIIGFRVIWHKTTSRGDHGEFIGGHIILEPNSPPSNIPPGYDTEILAWDHAPSWTSEYAIAFALIESVQYFIRYSPGGGHWIALTVFVGEVPSRRNFIGLNASLPRAICEAWLNWKEYNATS